MRSECMPTVTLEIRPMVYKMVQDMGIRKSELAEAIEQAIEIEIKRNILELPKIVKEEVRRMFEKQIHEECDAYAAEWMSPEWVKADNQMLKTFRSTISTEVMIAITKYVKENGKIINKK